MPGFRNMGPACCCCKDTLQTPENRATLLSTPSALLKQINAPTEVREVKLLQPVNGGGGQRIVGCGVPDWKNSRMVFCYMQNIRDGGGNLIDRDAVFYEWDAKGSAGSTGLSAPHAALIGTKSSFYADAIAVDPDNEHIYFSGHDYDYPDGSANYGLDIYRMDFDSTNQTNLATVDVYRTGSTAIFGLVGPMLVHRPEARLYYVVRQNYTTASNADWVWEIRYRDLATFTETSIYSVTSARLGTDLGDTYIRLLNCLSFDLTDGKVYWCEHYTTAVGSRQEGKVRRANLDGSGVELLYQSTDPATVNFARYSNKLGKIVHGDYDRTSTTPSPLDGIWLRDKAAWGTAPELIALEATPEAGSFQGFSSYLWCGYEVTGGSAVV